MKNILGHSFSLLDILSVAFRVVISYQFATFFVSVVKCQSKCKSAKPNGIPFFSGSQHSPFSGP